MVRARGPRVDVAGIGVEPVVVVDEGVVESADARRDDGGAGGHRFERDGAERFGPLGRHGDDVGLAEQLVGGVVVEMAEVGDRQSEGWPSRRAAAVDSATSSCRIFDDAGDAELDGGSRTATAPSASITTARPFSAVIRPA